MWLRRTTCVLAVLSAMASCNNDGSPVDIATGGSGGAAGGGGGVSAGGGAAGAGAQVASGAQAFTAAEATSILVALEVGELQQAQLALQRTTSADVRLYAQQMVLAYTQGVARLQAVQGTVSTGDTTAVLLAGDEQRATQALQTAARFDLEFMTAQIASHAKRIGLLDQVLVPSVAASASVGSDASAGTGAGDAEAGSDAGGLISADAALDGDLIVQAVTTTATSAGSPLLAELATARGDALQHLTLALALQKTLR